MRTTMAAAPAANIEKQIAALRDMTLADLRETYHEVFGEETRSRHKDFLRKRIAWRLQANEEGDLSERARRRAAEIANDTDIRVRVPAGAFDAGLPAFGRTRTHAFPGAHDPRLPMPLDAVYRNEVSSSAWRSRASRTRTSNGSSATGGRRGAPGGRASPRSPHGNSTCSITPEL